VIEAAERAVVAVSTAETTASMLADPTVVARLKSEYEAPEG
jgi:hypothetical protein